METSLEEKKIYIELLEALKGLVEAKKMVSKNPEGVLASMKYRWERAARAIAKAEGGE